jgi:23S rRNA pseudouridine955/2504/2580 synthase/23S rRNA pseudouridine1911/1915/1917 synthase
MPDRPSPLAVLYDTPDYIAVMKPPGLATIPGRAETDSVLERLGRQIGLASAGTVDPRLRVVHRLDKDTSGVLLFAKHVAAQRHVSQQFQNNTTRKEYLALTAGKPGDESGEIVAPIAVHPTVKTRMAVSKHGRPAVTRWQVEQRFRLGTLLRVFPQTGKTHQIRVHLASLRLPLWIDPIYGSDAPIYLSRIKRDYRRSNHEERPLIDRLTLHAHRLTFLAMDGSPVTIEAPPPKDLAATIRQLGKL